MRGAGENNVQSFSGHGSLFGSPGVWSGGHTYLVVFIGRALNAQLPSGFAAKIEERVYLQREDATFDDRSVRPDVLVRRDIAAATRGGTAVLERPLDSEGEIDAPNDVFLLSPRERERFIEVVTTDDERRVITVIEILSPANKTLGSGHKEYVNKQQSLLQSETHLLEIDLLRAGRHTVAVPEGAVREQKGTWSYLFSLHRGGEYDHFQYWSKTMREPLPRTLLVPLTEGLPDVRLDLQTAFDEAYDAGAYARQINYAAEPFPPLLPDDAEWANAFLQGVGRRSILTG